MSKRFTDTEKWEDPWFMDLSPKEKLVYLYILDKCSTIGLWKPNKRLCEFFIGEPIDWDAFQEKLGPDRLQVVNNGYWWMVKFINFQYGVLEESSGSKPIQSYIRELKKQRLWEGYAKGILTPKEKEKDQEKEKDKDQVKEKEKDIGLMSDEEREKWIETVIQKEERCQ